MMMMGHLYGHFYKKKSICFMILCRLSHGIGMQRHFELLSQRQKCHTLNYFQYSDSHNLNTKNLMLETWHYLGDQKTRQVNFTDHLAPPIPLLAGFNVMLTHLIITIWRLYNGIMDLFYQIVSACVAHTASNDWQRQCKEICRRELLLKSTMKN